MDDIARGETRISVGLTTDARTFVFGAGEELPDAVRNVVKAAARVASRV